MNITGLMLLKENGLPIMENTLIFRQLSEIKKENLDKYGVDKLWAMRGFDDRTKLSDSPYNVKNPRVHGFSKDELNENFQLLSVEMDKLDIPKEHRIFLICRVFFNQDVEFSGHAFRSDNKIFIDFLNGNRPSGRDWTPDVSFSIPLINNRPIYSHINDKKFEDYIMEICRAILMFGDKTYIDFTKFKSGYFFYHDLSVH